MLHGAGAALVLLTHLLGSLWGSAAPDNAPLPPTHHFPQASATCAAIPQNHSHQTKPNRAAAPAAAPRTGRCPAKQHSLKPHSCPSRGLLLTAQARKSSSCTTTELKQGEQREHPQPVVAHTRKHYLKSNYNLLGCRRFPPATHHHAHFKTVWLA